MKRVHRGLRVAQSQLYVFRNTTPRTTERLEKFQSGFPLTPPNARLESGLFTIFVLTFVLSSMTILTWDAPLADMLAAPSGDSKKAMV